MPTNDELAREAQKRFDSGIPTRQAVRTWLARHVPPRSGEARWSTSYGQWLDFLAENFVADPEIRPYLRREPA